jgi:hypothetical protein
MFLVQLNENFFLLSKKKNVCYKKKPKNKVDVLKNEMLSINKLYKALNGHRLKGGIKV